MTQGAQPANPVEEFDADQWLAHRGLTGERRLTIGGASFDFKKLATAEELAAFQTARTAGEIVKAIGILLVDPDDRDRLNEAFARQKSPVAGNDELAFYIAILNFIIAGDLGESSASSPQSSDSGGTPSSSTSTSTTTETSA